LNQFEHNCFMDSKIRFKSNELSISSKAR